MLSYFGDISVLPLFSETLAKDVACNTAEILKTVIKKCLAEYFLKKSFVNNHTWQNYQAVQSTIKAQHRRHLKTDFFLTILTI